MPVSRGGVNFNVHPDEMHHLLKNYVFVKVVEAEEDSKTNWDQCENHCVQFYNFSQGTQGSSCKSPTTRILRRIQGQS